MRGQRAGLAAWVPVTRLPHTNTPLTGHWLGCINRDQTSRKLVTWKHVFSGVKYLLKKRIDLTNDNGGSSACILVPCFTVIITEMMT